MLTIRDLTSDDVANVVAAVQRDQRIAHRRNRFVNGALDRDELAEALARRRARTWIARDGDRLVGHLTATPLSASSGGPSAWISPDAVSFDRPSTLAHLYAEAGEQWINDGVLEHVAWVYDRPDAREPWLDLNFAVMFRRGSRALNTPRETRLPSGYEGRWASLDDLDLAVALTKVIDEAEARGPSFVAEAPLDRDELATTLEDPDTMYYVVEHAGEGIAQCIAFPLLPVRGAYPRTLHLSAVVVQREHRGRGVATAMLNDVLTGARNRGFDYVDVTWRTANSAAAAFWTAYGLTPTYVRLRRLVDRR